MNNVFEQFYKSFYLKTNGFIPTNPLHLKVYPGDFFQIRKGELIVLGNIFRKGIIDTDKIDFEYGMKLNPVNWDFSQGVSKPYSGRSSGHNEIEGDFNFSKQILAFKDRGSFSFRGFDPEVVKFTNWSDIKEELIIKLTQVYYSFRELYLVTDVATLKNWTLAVAGSENAELEIAMSSEDYGLVDVFGHADSTTVQAKDIEYYNREEHRKPAFYKAKRLAIRDEKLEVIISDLIKGRSFKDKWVHDFFNYDFHDESTHFALSNNIYQASILDMLSANELNPNTALSYFKWVDTNLDDIELLFN